MTATTPLHHGASALDPTRLRSDFPCLASESVYLDSVASSLTPVSVVEAMNEYYFSYRANVHRGSYDASMMASEQYEAALAKVAAFIGADPEEVVFTSNTTLALNLAALSLPLSAGDEIVLSTLEHTSNMAPWALKAYQVGATIRWYNPGPEGVFEIDDFVKLLNERTRIVALTYVSNVLGTVYPVEAIANACSERGIVYVVDAAQAVPHRRIDVHALGCDFLAFSGHKMLGPTGIGVLYMKREHAETLMPGIAGGGTIDTTAECRCPSIDECGPKYVTFSALPDKWQAGTPPIAEAIGLGAAVDYLQAVGMENVHRHSQSLAAGVAGALRSIPGIQVYGPEEASLLSSIVSFNLANVPPDEVGRMLNERYHIAVRSGAHCALSYFMGADAVVDVPGNVRASFYLYNTQEEAQQFASAVREIASFCS
ncbi:aminotransferase class V-fold PLP-dependent enzyme [Streptacidiphilus carbonis]|uniref:aminotransferase class V-fold PLP-dependent enzyme n=1 Tax=Streptacidiphilus carbonis TaxID=105422 RepID=UPI0006941385|nr:cysteine desulfurase [Streptacidiphilus carbonis]